MALNLIIIYLRCRFNSHKHEQEMRRLRQCEHTHLTTLQDLVSFPHTNPFTHETREDLGGNDPLVCCKGSYFL